MRMLFCLFWGLMNSSPFEIITEFDSDNSQLLAIAWPTLQICAVVYGSAGKHMYDVTYEEYGRFKTFANIDKLIFFLAVGFIKVSIGFFNRRLTSLTSRAWSIFNNIFLFLLFVYINLALFWNIFQCDPPYAGWDAIRTAKRGKRFHCTSDTIVGSALSVIHVFMDFGLLSVPLIDLWKVRMSWFTRLRSYFVFSIASMSVIGSILRQIEQERISMTDILCKAHLTYCVKRPSNQPFREVRCNAGLDAS
jgi:Fungal rhodopsin domain